MQDNINNNFCGFVAIVGAPNAGKSTLVNGLVGQKISIVSQKIQTTRFPVRGIIMHDNAQIILVDTPGVFKPKQRLDRAMVASVWTGANDADLIVHVVDSSLAKRVLDNKHQKGDDKYLMDINRVEDGISKIKKNAILVLNKIDEVSKADLFALAQYYHDTGLYSDIAFVSALKSDGFEKLIEIIAKHIPEGVWLYPEDQASDIPLRLMAAEITREKVFTRLHDELPYSSSVETDSWKEQANGSVRIEQTLYVSRESHKAIAIGKGGQTLKWISSKAREEISKEIERPVHLFLYVKVKNNWQDDRQHYKERGLDFDV